MIRALLNICFGLAVICSAPARADPLFGAVTAVSDGGQITLDTSEKFYLWGMVPTDPKRFRDALVGRRLYCNEVLGAMDCLMFPRDELQLTFPIMALIWLPDMGVAKYSCKDTSVVISEGSAWGFAPGTYECRDGKPQFPSHSVGLARAKDFGGLLEERRNLLKP
jgi:hypothetical protein